MNRIKQWLNDYGAYGVFLISFSAMLGSLYISEIEKIRPCPLCWWQRIWMYPLVFIVAIGIILKDKLFDYYVAALSFIGILFATYQNLLQSTDIFTESESCIIGGFSCATPTKALELGDLFISLEFLSLIGFVAIFLISSLRIYFKNK